MGYGIESRPAAPGRTPLFGVLRLSMALVVVLVHLTWSPRVVPFGICAVMVFFMVSGYAMSALARSWCFMERGRIGGYMLDRVARIMPQYLFWLVVAFVLASEGAWPPWTATVPLDLPNFLLNASLMPVMLGRVLPIGFHSPLIPQAWTLGTEMVFYALLPVLLFSRRLALCLTLLSLAVFAAAVLDAIPLFTFAYIAPCGTLPFFVLGHALYRRDLRLAGIIVVLALAPLLLSALRGTLGHHPGLNVDTGLLLAVLAGPAILLFVERGVRFPKGLDRLFGDLAFGAYLSHDAMIGLLLWLHQPERVIYGGTLLLALVNGWVGWTLIDRPIAAWRRRRRQPGVGLVDVPAMVAEVAASVSAEVAAVAAPAVPG